MLISLALLLAGCPPAGRGPVTAAGTSRVGGGAQVTSASERAAYGAVATLNGVHYAATADRLLRFDPKTEAAVAVEALAGQRVVGLSAESSSGLWAATDRKLWRLHRDKWTSVDFPPSLGGASSAMQATRKGVWVGGTRGLGYLRDGKWNSYLPGARITYLLEDMQTGGVWVGTAGEGLYKYEKGKFVTHSPAKGQTVRHVRCISYTPEGGLLVVGQSADGERLTFFDGRFWTSYRVAPEGVLHWAQMVEQDLFVGHGHGVFRLKRAMPQVSRPGDRRKEIPRGPVTFKGTPAKDAPYGYPVPIFYTEQMETWLPSRISAITGYARHLLLGTPGMGMGHFDGKKVTWLRAGDLLGDNGRLRMACAGDSCYLPGKDGTAYRHQDEQFEPVEVTAEKGARVQGFLNLADGRLIAVHIPAGRQSLVVSVLQGERFVPSFESAFNYPSGRLEVRFLRQGPTGNIWAGLWYSDKVAERQPWGVVVLRQPEEKDEAPPPTPAVKPKPAAAKPAAGAAGATPAADETKKPDWNAGAKPAAGDKEPAAEGEKAQAAAKDAAGAKAKEGEESKAATKEEEKPETAAKEGEKPKTANTEPVADVKKPEAAAPETAAEETPPGAAADAPRKEEPKPAAAPEVPRIPPVTFHRSTLLPDEDRPSGSLALPDDIRDVWFEKTFTWMATGLGVCRVKGQVVDLFSENEGLASELTYSVVRSFSGELLVATYSGVGRMMGTKWYFDFEGALSRATRVLLPVDEGLWLGTTRGVIRQGGGAPLHYHESHGLASDAVTDLYLERRPGVEDRLWVLTDLGLSIVRLR